jgi:hypothetical protein
VPENSTIYLFLRTKLYKNFDKPSKNKVFFVFLHIETEMKIEYG